jgi:hypothetical protein
MSEFPPSSSCMHDGLGHEYRFWCLSAVRVRHGKSTMQEHQGVFVVLTFIGPLCSYCVFCASEYKLQRKAGRAAAAAAAAEAAASQQVGPGLQAALSFDKLWDSLNIDQC